MEMKMLKGLQLLIVNHQAPSTLSSLYYFAYCDECGKSPMRTRENPHYLTALINTISFWVSSDETQAVLHTQWPEWPDPPSQIPSLKALCCDPLLFPVLAESMRIFAQVLPHTNIWFPLLFPLDLSWFSGFDFSLISDKF